MTAIVGIYCTNGAVIGTDGSTTFVAARGVRTVEQPTKKIEIIANKIILAGTGQVGYGQRFLKIVEDAWQEKLFQKSSFDVAKKLSLNAQMDLRDSNGRLGEYGSLVAFPVEKTPHLCEFAVTDFQPEFKTLNMWYCSMGSAQYITDTLLGFMREVFWSDGAPDLNEGVFAATWVLDQAISLNPGGVNDPIHIAVLEHNKNGQLFARVVTNEELAEHRQNIEEAKKALRNFRESYKVPQGGDVPSVPKRHQDKV